MTDNMVGDGYLQLHKHTETEVESSAENHNLSESKEGMVTSTGERVQNKPEYKNVDKNNKHIYDNNLETEYNHIKHINDGGQKEESIKCKNIKEE